MELLIDILFTIGLLVNLILSYRKWKHYINKHIDFKEFTPRKIINENNKAIKRWKNISLFNSLLLLAPAAFYLKQYIIGFIVAFSVTIGFGFIVSVLKLIDSKSENLNFQIFKDKELNKIILFAILGFIIITLVFVFSDKEIQQLILNHLKEKENGIN